MSRGQRYLGFVLLGLLVTAPVWAQTLNVFANGQPMSAASLNQNFNRLLNKIHTITGADIQFATITKDNIADFTITDQEIAPNANISITKLDHNISATWPRAWVDEYIHADTNPADGGAVSGCNSVSAAGDGTHTITIGCTISVDYPTITVNVTGVTTNGWIVCNAGPHILDTSGTYTSYNCIGSTSFNIPASTSGAASVQIKPQSISADIIAHNKNPDTTTQIYQYTLEYGSVPPVFGVGIFCPSTLTQSVGGATVTAGVNPQDTELTCVLYTQP